MSVSKEEMQEAIQDAVTKAFEEQPQLMACNLGIDKDTHTAEHQFINSLMGMSEKLESIKWGLIGAVVKTTGMVVIGLICLGAITWAKSELKIGG